METAGPAKSTPPVAIHSRRKVVSFLMMLWCTSLSRAPADEQAAARGMSHGCIAALEAECGAVSGDVFDCAQCAGTHQAGLKAAGCTNDDIAQWCAGATRSAFAGSQLLTQADGKRIDGWIDGSGRAAAAKRSWALCFSSFSDPHSNPQVFHRQCDAHNLTVSVARNALNFSFGGFATSSWSKASCCASPVNDCGTVSCFVNAETGASDFIFRLRPGTPTKYGITGSNEYYQDVNPNQWPQWGMFGHDLSIGGDYLNAPSAAPGAYGECTQGNTYQGAPGQVCGGKNNWGKTDLEVWVPHSA